MCCILDASYIVNSDPSILEKLKDCSDLTSAQVTAVEALLQSGSTQYGYVCPGLSAFTSSPNFSLTICGFFPRQSSVHMERADAEGSRHAAALSDLDLL